MRNQKDSKTDTRLSTSNPQTMTEASDKPRVASNMNSFASAKSSVIELIPELFGLRWGENTPTILTQFLATESRHAPVCS